MTRYVLGSHQDSLRYSAPNDVQAVSRDLYERMITYPPVDELLESVPHIRDFVVEQIEFTYDHTFLAEVLSQQAGIATLLTFWVDGIRFALAEADAK